MNVFRTSVVLVLAAIMSACGHAPRKELAGPRTDADKLTCGAYGGSIQKVCGTGYEVCVAPYPDGGKPCADSSECLGRCTVPATQPMIPPGENKGACQKANVTCDCYREVLNGKVRRAGFCPA